MGEFVSLVDVACHQQVSSASPFASQFVPEFVPQIYLCFL
jgi:hypothetical protein